MGRSVKRRGLTQTGSDEGNKFTSRTSKQIEDYHSGGKRSFSYKRNDRGKIVKIPQMLTGGQAEIAAKAPPRNKIDGKDFAVLRAEKAKGRGMGLQDEKVKPGKVMKAKRGHFSKSNISGHKRVMGEAKDYKNYLKGLKQATMSSKAKKAGEAAAKVAKSTRLGKIALGVAGAGIAAKKFIESDKFKNMLKKKMNKKMGGGMMKKYSKGGVSSKEVYTNARANVDAEGRKNMTMKDLKEARRETYSTKKMGGGMMNKPMGYKSGTMVMARGCKLGRKKATKIT